MLKILIKITTKLFLNRLIRRENTVLFKSCSFNSATYIKGFCYIIVDFLRGNEAKKKIFKRRYKIRFLMDRTAVENLNNVICVLSNDVSCDKGFFCI